MSLFVIGGAPSPNSGADGPADDGLVVGAGATMPAGGLGGGGISYGPAGGVGALGSDGGAAAGGETPANAGSDDWIPLS